MDINKELIEKYGEGNRLAFYVSGIQHINILDPNDIQALLSNVNHIKKGFEYYPMRPWLKEGLLTSHGNKWHTRRKMLTPTFHFSILYKAINIMSQKTDHLLENITNVCGKIVKVEDLVSKCALDIIGEVAMGIDLKAQSEEEGAYVKSIKKTGESLLLRILNVWECKDWIFKLSQNGRNFYKSLKVLQSYTEKVIEKRKETNTMEFHPQRDEDERKIRRAFLDCILQTQREQPGLLNDSDIREEVETFMFAGHDTLSNSISFAIWLLGSHIEEQEKVYKEIQEVLGDNDRMITMSDLQKMNYLERVIKETIRLFPSAPFISRRLSQDCPLDDGKFFPAQSNVSINIYLLHRNEKYFPNPEKFDPERFNEEQSLGRHPYAYLPFSAGPRNCIGQKFAMLEMKIVLSKLFKRFKVTAVTKREEFKVIPSVLIQTTVPLEVIFSPRE